MKSTYSSVKSAAYITALPLPRFNWTCNSNSVGATAAHNSLNVAFVGCPRFKLHKIFLLPGALARLRALGKEGPVTLVYAAKDTDYRHAPVLREFLQSKGE